MSFFRRRSQRSSSPCPISRSRSLRIENLERKDLLAGDVTAAIVGGNLVLTGDAANNNFQIVRNEMSPGVGSVKIIGLPDNLLVDTTITYDGTTGPNATLAFTGDIIIDFSAGGDNAATVGDQLNLIKLQLPGGISVQGGNDGDALFLFNVEIGNGVSVSDPAGSSSQIFVSGANVPGSVDVSTGGIFAALEISNESFVGGNVDFGATNAALVGQDFTFSILESTIAGDVDYTVPANAAISNLTLFDSDIAGSVNASLSNSADTVSIVDTPTLLPSEGIGGSLLLSTGDGFDSVEIVNLTVGNDMRISTGADGIGFIALSVNVVDDVVLNGGSGADEFVFDVDSALNAIGDDLYASTGAGGDTVAFVGGTIGDKVRISTGDGNDTAAVIDSSIGRSALITVGDGEDQVILNALDAGRSLTILGRGANFIDLAGVQTTHFITIITSSGDDTVILNDTSTSSAMIATKAGMDTVSIAFSEFDYLFALLGSGDDTLTLEGVTVNRFAFLSGGTGEDELVDVGDNDINFQLDFSFEELTVV